MRLGFIFIVLLIAILVWKLVDQQVHIAHREVEVRKVLPMNLEYEKVQARLYLDNIRASMRMQSLLPNDTLQSAAQEHAKYLMLNNSSAHEEMKGYQNFTGAVPYKRAFHAGYQSLHVSENLSTKNPSAKNSMDGLFAAIYHRFGFLSPSIDEIGMGISQDSLDSDKSAFVYLMGNSKLNSLCKKKEFTGRGNYVYKVCKEENHRIKEQLFHKALHYNKQHNPKIIFYPYDGQENLVPAFYAENPDPLPDYEVSGLPISVEFNDYYFKEVSILSFKLYRGDEEITEVRLMDKYSDPHHKFNSNQFALFPLKRLEYESEYRVELVYQVKKKRETLIWHFQTQKFPQELHTINKKEESIFLKASEEHIIYFRPLDEHELLLNLKFPAGVDVQLIDYNTIKLRLNSDDTISFDIVADNRRLHVKVEK